MKMRFHGAWMVFLGVAAGAASAEKPPALADIIYDKAGFIERLPKKCLTYSSLMDGVPGIPDATQAFIVALHELGEPKGIEFVDLPGEFSYPVILSSRSPDYPRAKAGALQPGHADFLVLIGRTGKIAALYCTDATDRLFAIAGANTLVQWSFAPTYMGQQGLPVLVMVRTRFTVVYNGVTHEG